MNKFTWIGFLKIFVENNENSFSPWQHTDVFPRSSGHFKTSAFPIEIGPISSERKDETEAIRRFYFQQKQFSFALQSLRSTVSIGSQIKMSSLLEAKKKKCVSRLIVSVRKEKLNISSILRFHRSFREKKTDQIIDKIRASDWSFKLILLVWFILLFLFLSCLNTLKSFWTWFKLKREFFFKLFLFFSFDNDSSLSINQHENHDRNQTLSFL